MLPKTLSPDTIRALNKLAKKLYDVCVHIPTQEQVKDNKATIEKILPPNHGKVTEPYTVRVSIAYEYARVHYQDTGSSLLSDIEKNPNIVKTIDLSEYKFRSEDTAIVAEK